MGTLLIDNVHVQNSPASSIVLQRVQTGNRSPLESQPAAKKQLKTGQQLEFVAAPAMTSSGKENRSILKHPQRVAAIIANELGGASVGGARTRSWPGSLRRVNFEQSVDVLVYDRADGDVVGSESQQLNTEPRDRKQFIGRSMVGRQQTWRNSTASTSGHRQLDRVNASPSTSRPLPPGPPAATTSSSSGTPEQNDLDFTFYEDPRGQLRIKFTVPLGPGVAAGDALVKANVAGNKIRVLGTRTVTSAGIVTKQEISSRYSLPMDVDPYAITARMDSSGNLFVEAPVMTGDRRRTVGAMSQIGNVAAA